MQLTDVTQPVIINATTAVTRESPTHLRRVCLISLGMTTLAEGEFREVFKFDYANYVRKYTEINTKCAAFFAQANNKGLVLLELGMQAGTPLEDSFETMIGYLETIPAFSIIAYYRWVLQTQWADRDMYETPEYYQEFYNFYNAGNPFDSDNYELWAQVNLKDPLKAATMVEYMDAVLPRAWRDAYVMWVYNNNEDYRNNIDKNTLDAYLKDINAEFFNEEDYQIYLEENGTKNDNYEDKVAGINRFINECKMPCYIYILPDGMERYSAIGETLFALYTDLKETSYFFANFRNDMNPQAYQADGIIENFQNQKSAALFIDNTTSSNLAALTAGLFASSKFDLSQTNPASPFNYKELKGVKFNTLSKPTKQAIIQDSANFIDSVAQVVVLLNGRYGDSFAIDYRYQWDLTSFQISADLSFMIINGVNNPNYVIKYDQNGIDTIEARIVATLNNMIEIGAVTEFAASMNPADNSLENIGNITCIPFRQYIEANPADYTNGIYSGVSFYLRVGNFVRQVIINATLG